jgi:hypothetical protein
MAKHYNTGVKKDPAIEVWAYMRENTTQKYKVTPRTFGYAFVGLILFPGFVYWGAARYQVRLLKRGFNCALEQV